MDAGWTNRFPSVYSGFPIAYSICWFILIMRSKENVRICPFRSSFSTWQLAAQMEWTWLLYPSKSGNLLHLLPFNLMKKFRCTTCMELHRRRIRLENSLYYRDYGSLLIFQKIYSPLSQSNRFSHWVICRATPILNHIPSDSSQVCLV